MEENKKSPLDKFEEILEQQHKNAIKGINRVLYNDILKTAKVVAENEDKINLKEIISNLHERFKNERPKSGYRNIHLLPKFFIK
jgi:biotin synthase-like enzyme